MLLPAAGHVLLEIMLRTGVIYVLVLIGVRVSGKREVGQMTPFDPHAAASGEDSFKGNSRGGQQLCRVHQN
jgi:hypothetical protein